jgi:CYTH domain-containing protein
MPLEIERKFPVAGDAWRADVTCPEYGYPIPVADARYDNASLARSPWRAWTDVPAGEGP